jgi:hypothetical protein
MADASFSSKIYDDRATLLKASIGALVTLRMVATAPDGTLLTFVQSRSGSMVKVVDTIAELERAICSATGASV